MNIWTNALQFLPVLLELSKDYKGINYEKFIGKWPA